MSLKKQQTAWKYLRARLLLNIKLRRMFGKRAVLGKKRITDVRLDNLHRRLLRRYHRRFRMNFSS
jgi:hypothetical protein